GGWGGGGGASGGGGGGGGDARDWLGVLHDPPEVRGRVTRRIDVVVGVDDPVLAARGGLSRRPAQAESGACADGREHAHHRTPRRGLQPAAMIVARSHRAPPSTSPIVMTELIDLVRVGLIASLARPGNNTTGISNMFHDIGAYSFLPRSVAWLVDAPFDNLRQQTHIIPSSRGRNNVSSGQ